MTNPASQTYLYALGYHWSLVLPLVSCEITRPANLRPLDQQIWTGKRGRGDCGGLATQCLTTQYSLRAGAHSLLSQHVNLSRKSNLFNIAHSRVVVQFE